MVWYGLSWTIMDYDLVDLVDQLFLERLDYNADKLTNLLTDIARC